LPDPNVPGRIYLGAFDRIDISQDGGLTWPISATLTRPPEYAACGAMPVWVIQADPFHPGTLLAGVSHPCGGPFFAKGGVYKSTGYGLNWTRVSFTQEISYVSDLEYDPHQANVVYAATSGSGFFKSMDGGDHWTAIGVQQPELRNAVDVEVEPVPPYRVFGTHGGGVVVSNNGGTTFTDSGYVPGQHMVRQILFVDEPAGYRLYQATTVGLYRYVPGATFWEPAAGLLGHVNVQALASAAAVDRAFLYAGTLGGAVETGAASIDILDTGRTLVGAGVYRFTKPELTERVYLPMVMKR
jgi:hypothetical protein